MNVLKIIIKIFVLLIFSLNLIFSVNSIGGYDEDGNYNYLINNNQPTISFNISSPAEPIYIDKARIIANGINYDYLLTDSNILNPDDGIKNFNFYFNYFQDLENLSYYSNNYHFKLFAYGQDGKEIIPEGDPVDFFLNYDNLSPSIQNPLNSIDEIYLSITNNKLPITFSEKINKFEVYLNGNLINSTEFNFNYLKDYPNQIELNFENQLNEGTNSFKIVFWDLAGNNNTFEKNINFRGENLKLSLLTLRNDSSLKYNFNSDYLSLFDNSIYSSSSSFILKVKTSKPAYCYFTSIINSFAYYGSLTTDSYKLMDSSDKLIHSVNLNVINDSKIWVFCRNVVYDDDFAYLSSSMGIGERLINLKLYQQSSVKINRVLPNEEVTSIPFNFSVDTSSKSICFFARNGADYIRLNTSNFLYHSKSMNLNNGNYNYNFKCVDVLNNFDSKNINLNVNTNIGVRILSYSPKYTDSSSINLKLGLSEDALCRYSLTDIPVQNSGNLTEIPGTGTGLSREFTLSPLVQGNNTLYIYCLKGVSIFKKNINIIYDKNPPKISNFTFMNNAVPSSYLGSLDKLEFSFKISSLIPINKYYLSVEKNNYTINKIFSTNHPVIHLDLKNATYITIIAENILGKNSSELKKDLKFDLEPPTINFDFTNDKVKINCFDIGGSGCSKIYYSFSKTSICDPSISYKFNTSLNVADNNYICAYGIDNVGHKSDSKLNPILFGNSNDLINDSNDIFNDTEGYNSTNISNDIVSSNSTEINNVEDPWANNSTEEKTPTSTNYLLISALFLVLVGVSGTGYYAYKKGYLNDELKKLGIKIPNQNNSSKVFTPNLNKNSRIKSKFSSKSKYDHHLNKLNSFIDSEISKGDRLFNKFNKKTLAEEKFGETLTKNIKKPLSDLSKDDFDAIYDSSKNINETASNNVKKEAEDFENFYKKIKKDKLDKKKKVITKKKEEEKEENK